MGKHLNTKGNKMNNNNNNNEIEWSDVSNDAVEFEHTSLNIKSDATSVQVRSIPGFDKYCISETSEIFRIDRFSNHTRVKYDGSGNIRLTDNHGKQCRVNITVLMDMVGFNNCEEVILLPDDHRRKAYRIFTHESYFITNNGVLLKQFHDDRIIVIKEVSDGKYRITIGGVRKYIASEELIGESNRLMGRYDGRKTFVLNGVETGYEVSEKGLLYRKRFPDRKLRMLDSRLNYFVKIGGFPVNINGVNYCLGETDGYRNVVTMNTLNSWHNDYYPTLNRTNIRNVSNRVPMSAVPIEMFKGYSYVNINGYITVYDDRDGTVCGEVNNKFVIYEFLGSRGYVERLITVAEVVSLYALT